MATTSELSPERMAGYREGARRLREKERAALVVRERRARLLADQAAELLRRHFQIDRVVLFGSLIHPGCFTAWSDVDIAVWGLRPDETLRAIGMAMDLDNEIAVNLVDIACCRASIREVIEREGVDL